MTATMPTSLTPREMSTETGISLDTLRYYERAGLMPGVERLPNGHRRYGQSDIEWIRIVQCLRTTGMPIRDIRRYTTLALDGDHTIEERLSLLRVHREEVIRQMDELKDNLDHLDGKIAWYESLEGAS